MTLLAHPPLYPQFYPMTGGQFDLILNDKILLSCTHYALKSSTKFYQKLQLKADLPSSDFIPNSGDISGDISVYARKMSVASQAIKRRGRLLLRN